MGKLFQKNLNSFECLASCCPDTCCACWQIYINDEKAKEYLQDKGEVGSIAKECMRGKSGSYHLALKDKRCPYLNENNLCKVIINKGENALSTVCKNHPRFTHPLYEDEFSFLSLSCPKAAQMFIKCVEKDGVEYEKENLENPYLSQFYDSVCEILVPLSNNLDKLIYKNEELSSLFSSLFSSFEYLEKETKDALCNIDLSKIKKEHISKDKKLFSELFKYFALVLYDEKAPVLPVAFVFALSTLYLCSVFSDKEKAIYKFVKETEHSTKNIAQAVRILRSPKAKNILKNTFVFSFIY